MRSSYNNLFGFLIFRLMCHDEHFCTRWLSSINIFHHLHHTKEKNISVKKVQPLIH